MTQLKEAAALRYIEKLRKADKVGPDSFGPTYAKIGEHYANGWQDGFKAALLEAEMCETPTEALLKARDKGF